MDNSAFEREARTWHRKALMVSRSCGAGRQEAEDTAQDVMLRLWQMRRELDRYESVEAVAALMARHLTRNRQRRRPPEQQLDEAAIVALTTGGPHEQLVSQENEQWLAQRLQQLPTTQHAILYMRQMERRSHAEIARLLGIEPASVSTLLARARHSLLEEIKRRNNT